jgi:cytoskeletal protein RodZ
MTESIGDYLKRAREGRGLSIVDLSRATKIKEAQLERLEAGRLRELPAAVFVVGFVRAYARQVGLDEGEAVRRLRREQERHEEPAVPVEIVALEEPSEALGGRRFGVALVVFLILVVATVTLSLLLRHSSATGGMS